MSPCCIQAAEAERERFITFVAQSCANECKRVRARDCWSFYHRYTQGECICICHVLIAALRSEEVKENECERHDVLNCAVCRDRTGQPQREG